MHMFRERHVHDYQLKEKAQRHRNGNVVGWCWVKVKKGVHREPNVRCRLVAQEFPCGEVRDDLFAGTPLLDAMKSLISKWCRKRADTCRSVSWCLGCDAGHTHRATSSRSATLVLVGWLANYGRQCATREMRLRSGTRKCRS